MVTLVWSEKEVTLMKFTLCDKLTEGLNEYSAWGEVSVWREERGYDYELLLA